MSDDALVTAEPDAFRAVASVALALAAAVAAVLVLDISRTAALASAILALAVLPAMVAWGRGRFDLLEIIHPILLLHGLYFGVRTFYILSSDVDDLLRPMFTDTIDNALVFTLIGMACLLGGYYAPLGTSVIADHTPRIKAVLPERLVRAALVLIAIGLGCRMWVYSAGYYTRFLSAERAAPSGYLMAIDFGAWASYYGFVLAVATAARWEAGRFFPWFVWTVLAPLTFGLAFLGGAKLDVIWLIAGILLTRHYLGRSVRTWHVGAAAVILILVVFPLVNSYRTLAGSNLDLSPHQAATGVPGAVAEQTAGDFVEDAWRSAMARVPGVDALALVIKYTPELTPFQHGKTIVIAPLIAFIPTAIWPGKYDFINSVVSGVDFGSDYFGIEGNASGIAITQLGELYLNFGPLGIPLGMFVIGLLCRFAYQWFRLNGRTPLGLLVYVFVYVHLIFIEGWFGSTYSNLLKHLVATSLIAWICLKLDSSAVIPSRRFAGAR